MLKFMPQYTAWKLNHFQYLFICACAKTGDIACYIATEAGVIHDFPAHSRLPDLRRLVPIRWLGLPPVLRCNIRHRFGEFLCENHGEEFIEVRHLFHGVGE